MLKKTTLLYFGIFLLAIVTGIYFVFATSGVVTITAIVPGDVEISDDNDSVSDAAELGWSYGSVRSDDSNTSDDNNDDDNNDDDNNDSRDVSEDVREDSSKLEERTQAVKPLGGVSFLTRFSVMVYWYKRSNPPQSADLNSDGQVTIVDFSILAHNAETSL